MIIANHLALSMKIEEYYRKPWPIFHVGNPVLPITQGPRQKIQLRPVPATAGASRPTVAVADPRYPSTSLLGKKILCVSLCCVSFTCFNLKVT
jgi:hypothetical protein